jgi:hypothetical protein
MLMRASYWLTAALLVPLGLAGCTGGPGDTGAGQAATSPAKDGGGDDPAAVAAQRAKLAPDDRHLVEAQDYCAIEPENRLGSMGPPFKLMLKGQPVFLCCKGCRRKALADPDGTLARAEELRAKRAAGAPRE